MSSSLFCELQIQSVHGTLDILSCVVPSYISKKVILASIEQGCMASIISVAFPVKMQENMDARIISYW